MTHNINMNGVKKLNSNFAGSKTERDRRGPGLSTEYAKMRQRKKATLTEARLEKIIKMKAQIYEKSKTRFKKKSYLHRKDTVHEAVPELHSIGLTINPGTWYNTVEHQTITSDATH
jgi:hypothetical protein